MANKGEMKKQKNSNKRSFASTLSTSNLIAASILVGVLSVVLALIVGKMLVGSMMLNARVLSKKTTANKQVASNYDALKNLQDQYSGLGVLRDTATSALPTKPDLPQLWSMMENIANTSGVAVSSVSSVATTDTDAPAGTAVQSLPITVSVQGSYTAMQTYLQNLERSARPLRITNITLSGTNNTVQANLSITTFYQGAADLNVGSEVVQ